MEFKLNIFRRVFDAALLNCKYNSRRPTATDSNMGGVCRFGVIVLDALEVSRDVRAGEDERGAARGSFRVFLAFGEVEATFQGRLLLIEQVLGLGS